MRRRGGRNRRRGRSRRSKRLRKVFNSRGGIRVS